MGFLNPFFFWPLASGNNDESHYNITNKPHAPRHSWTLVNRDQANGIETTPQSTTPSPTDSIGKILTPDYEHPRPDVVLNTTGPVDQALIQAQAQGAGSGKDDGLELEASGDLMRQSWRGSKRLSGIKTLLRPRRSQRHSASELLNTSLQLNPHVDGKAEQNHGVPEVLPDTEDDQQYADTCDRQIDQLHVKIEDTEQRKVSDRTVQSNDSEKTNSTVCHHLSRILVDQSYLENRGYVYENPFGDIWGLSGSNPYADEATKATACSTKLSISENGDVNAQPNRESHDKQKEPQTHRRSIPLEHLPRKSSIFRNASMMSNESAWSAQIDQNEVVNEFNNIAAELCLRPVTLEKQGSEASRKPDVIAEGKLQRRNGIIGRIRTMRSNIQMRSQSLPPELENRRLRRMKTLANMSSRAEPFCALKGKPLETLARLGGQNILRLPEGFAPAPLKLPVCFAATATYLRCYAPRVRNVFFDPGDLKAAARVYDHFANQVLSAEREEDKIEVTMRSNQMPINLVEILQMEEPIQRESYVLSVAWVLKALLAGLPDGILGSMVLYQTLVDISYGRTPHIAGPQETDSCLEELDPWQHVQTKAIALAILALTSKKHLELTCGVLGLCEVLLHETQRAIEIEWWNSVRKRERRPSWAAELLDVDRLSRTLGPLLTNRVSEEDHYTEYSTIVVPGVLKAERVARMLLETWRGVSRQLRWWERCGYPPARVVLKAGAEEEVESK